MFETHSWRRLLAKPRVTLAVMVVTGLMLALLPRRAVEPLATLYARCVDPGRAAAAQVREVCTTYMTRAQLSSATAAEVAELTDEVRRLSGRNRELETALAVAINRASEADLPIAAPESSPLVLSHAIRARVLGRRACAVLATGQIVALGQHSGVERDALALMDSTVGVDQGQDAGLTVGSVALAGRRVFGKVCDVGPHTSVVRRADQPGYRDVVQLAREVEGALQFGPQGILEGSGEHRCRVRLVSAAESVEPGNLVFTAQHEGLSPQPLLYGVVARAERRSGAPHWDIWVDLAAGNDGPNDLLVLGAQLNPERLATVGADVVPSRDD